MEVQGIWWIEDEAHYNKGKCYFSDGHIHLDTECDVANPLFEIPYNSCIKFIFGKLADGSYCTLFHCTPISGSMNANEQDTKKFKCEIFLKGGHIYNDQVCKSNSCRIVYTGLSAWMNLDPLEFNRNKEGIFVKYNYPTSNKFFIKSIKSHFDFLYYIKSEFTQGQKVALEITPYIEITPNDPQDIHWYIETCNKLNQFLTLLMGFDVSCTSLTIKNPDYTKNIVNNLEHIEIFTKNILNFNPSIAIEKGPIFITYNDISLNIKKILTEWFNIHKNFESPIDLFYQAIQKNSTIKWTFLNLIFAAEKIYDLFYDKSYIGKEDYGKIYEELKIIINKIDNKALKETLSIKLKKANSYTLQSKLIELLNEAKNILTEPIPDFKIFASEIAQTRHALAHGRTAENDQAKNTSDVDKLIMTLKTLIAYNLLKKILLDETFLENKFSTTYIPPYS